MRGSRAAAPKGTKSCRIQGDLCSVRVALWPKVVYLKPARADLRLEQPCLKLERADLRPER